MPVVPDEVLLGAGVVRVVGVCEVCVALLRGGLLLHVPQRVLAAAVMKTGPIVDTNNKQDTSHFTLHKQRHQSKEFNNKVCRQLC